MRFMALKSVLAAVVVTTGALSTHVAKAETTLNVPFNFLVAGQSMPSGLYKVAQDTFHNSVTLTKKDGSKSFSYTLRPGDSVPNNGHVALRFDSAGSSHVLRTIQCGSKVTSRLDNGSAPTAYDPARLSQGR